MKTDHLLAAIDARPDSPELYRKLGASHFNDGNIGESLGAFLMALILAPEDRANRANALKLLGMTGGYQVPGQVRSILADCAFDPDLDNQALASVIHSEFSVGSIADVLTEDLQAAGRMKFASDLAGGSYDSLFDDKLLKGVMANAILVTPPLERCLTELRRWLLESLIENDNAPNDFMRARADFLSALACQCFNTEYVYAVSNAELEAIESLAGEVDTNTDIIVLSVLGSYRHLHDLPKLALPDKSELSACQLEMAERLIEGPKHEASLFSSIPQVCSILNATSRMVQEQYETFPYPRWTSAETAERPMRFGKYVRQRFPSVRAKQVSQGSIDILVAGCGTGKQAVEVAATYKGATVTAVDLSRASLAYARARSDERELDNITFLQGDILELGALGQKFDLIECMGVLHHMADPGHGLKVLTGLLKPNGFLRLALYSTIARSEVAAARAFADEQGVDGSGPSIREYRQMVYGLPEDSPVTQIIKTRDFFSLSGLHDYVFNVQERSYSPLELGSLLDQHDLEFLGFDLPTTSIEKDYREANPADRFMNDLGAWDDFERMHPDTFSCMFQFWCRPVTSRS